MSPSTRAGCIIAVGILVFAGVFIPGSRAEDTAPRIQGPFRLGSSVMGAAGGRASSSNYGVKGTAGQSTPIGIGWGADKVLYAGFWSMPWIAASVLLSPDDVAATRIFQNHPNPFTASTTIVYSVARESDVEIDVFDVRGRKVSVLVDEAAAPGLYTVTWDGRDERGERVSPGVYFYCFSAGGHRAVKKMLFVK